MHCRNCGAPLKESAQVCLNCGVFVDGKSYSEKPKTLVFSIVLVLFVGLFLEINSITFGGNIVSIEGVKFYTDFSYALMSVIVLGFAFIASTYNLVMVLKDYQKKQLDKNTLYLHLGLLIVNTILLVSSIFTLVRSHQF